MSANAGPVADTYPTSRARGTDGMPMARPRMRKIRVTAKDGNQPDCMAARPTISSWTSAANAANSTQPTMPRGLMSPMSPPRTARTAAPPVKSAKPRIRESRRALSSTVWAVVGSVSWTVATLVACAAASFRLRSRRPISRWTAWPRATMPAPTMTPCGM